MKNPIPFQNVVRGVATTFLGSVFMGGAAYGYYVGKITNHYGALTLGVAGLILFFCPDKVPGWLDKAFNAAISIFSKKNSN